MSNKFKKLLFILFVANFNISLAFACQEGWKSAEELENESKEIVLATIISTRHVGTSFRGDDYEYKIKIEKSERGKLIPGELRITFEDLKSHLRGTKRVCAIKNGSGIEHNLQVSRKYKMYIKSADSLELLLARPETS